MTQHEIAIIALLAAQAASLCALWLTQQSCGHWRKAWTRDSAELLYWKRNGILRDPLTGKYRKKDKRNG
jgi:hypothetical protein